MDDYHEFIVKSDIKNVESGIIAAWFGLPGGGIQYKLPQMVSDLLRKGVLAEVTPHEL